MKKTSFFILFLFLIIISLYSSQSKIVGFLNESGIVRYTLSHFNDSTTTYSITYSQAESDTGIGFYLPQNATIDNAIMNVTGTSSNTLSFTYQTSYNLTGLSGRSYAYMDWNGSHYYISETGNDKIYIFNRTGANTSTIAISANEWGVAVSPTTPTVWVTDTGVDDSIDRVRGSQAPATIDLPDSNSARGIFFNGTYFYWTNTTGTGFVHITDTSGTEINSAEVEGIHLAYCNFGSNCDKTKFFTGYATTGLIYMYNMDLTGGLVANSSIDTFVSNPNGLAMNGTYFWAVNASNGIAEFTYSSASSPSNFHLSVNNTAFFNHTTNFNTSNITVDFKDYLQDALSECTPDGWGFCNIILNSTSNATGDVNFYNININYTVDISPSLDIINFWNKTVDIRPGEVVNISKDYRTRSTLLGMQINITGFYIDSATSCDIDGTAQQTATESGRIHCNLTVSQILNATGGDWTNHTVYDTTDGASIPVNQTNATQSFNTTHRLVYFNLTSFLPNGSSMSSPYTITNVTTKIVIDDSLLQSNFSQGIRYYNGSSWLNLNTTFACVNAYDEVETNYSRLDINGNTWYACYNDTDSDNIKDYFKILVPSMSTHEFYAFGEEDVTTPTLSNFSSPSGTFTTASDLTLNATATDDAAINTCWYNITNDANVIEKADEFLTNCYTISDTFNIGGGNDGYILYLTLNDTSGNLQINSSSFTVNVEEGGGGSPAPGGGGGGGSPDPQIIIVEIGGENATYFELKTDTNSKKYDLFINKNEVRKKLIQVINNFNGEVHLNLTCSGDNDICDNVKLSETDLVLTSRDVEFIDLEIDGGGLTENEQHFFSIDGKLKQIKSDTEDRTDIPYEDSLDVFVTVTEFSNIRLYIEKFTDFYDIFGIPIPKIIMYLFLSFMSTAIVSQVATVSKFQTKKKNLYMFYTFVIIFIISSVFDNTIINFITGLI